MFIQLLWVYIDDITKLILLIIKNILLKFDLRRRNVTLIYSDLIKAKLLKNRCTYSTSYTYIYGKQQELKELTPKIKTSSLLRSKNMKFGILNSTSFPFTRLINMKGFSKSSWFFHYQSIPIFNQPINNSKIHILTKPCKIILKKLSSLIFNGNGT